MQKLKEWIYTDEDINNIDININKEVENDDIKYCKDLIRVLEKNCHSDGFYIEDFFDCEQVIIDKTY